jgi:hypothetical protein
LARFVFEDVARTPDFAAPETFLPVDFFKGVEPS